MTDYKALCAELVAAIDASVPYATPLLDRARAALAQPEPVQESDAFAVVQKRLDQLASDQELMIYRWPDGQWTIDHSNPSWSAPLGEIRGKYSCTGCTFDEAVNNLAALLPAHALPVPTDD